MDHQALLELLGRVAGGAESPAAAAARIQGQAVEDLGFARLDHGRTARCGFPEVVFCQGKEPDQAARIAAGRFERSGKVLLTRATQAVYQAVAGELPEAIWHAQARCITALRPEAGSPPQGLVLVLCAGTADLPVAEEARVTAEIMGARVESLYDVGVAGLHRLLAHLETLRQARALVAVAGMEGALPSVVAGLVSAPVVAVPTSVGYGASFGGLSALLTMLNCCAAGVGVVNIDNGFGGGYLAALINRTAPG